jgi:hypothetical protein
LIQDGDVLLPFELIHRFCRDNDVVLVTVEKTSVPRAVSLLANAPHPESEPSSDGANFLHDSAFHLPRVDHIQIQSQLKQHYGPTRNETMWQTFALTPIEKWKAFTFELDLEAPNIECVETPRIFAGAFFSSGIFFSKFFQNLFFHLRLCV